MTTKTKLRSFIAAPASRYTLIRRVALVGAGLAVEVETFEPSNGFYTISFENIVGVRVLDERELPEFSHNGVQFEGQREPTLVYEVLSGGWFDQQKASSEIMKAGFYPALKEWVVLGEDWCVSVLAECAPTLCSVNA